MKIYGYCRVSTPYQKIDRQVSNVKAEFPDAIIFSEAFTGTSLNRPVWNKLYKKLQTGDTIIFDEVSRMSRNAEDGFALYKELYDRGINLVFLKQRHIDTAVFRETLEGSGVPMTGTDVDIILQSVNEYLMKLAERQIQLAFEMAQKEVDFLHKRTSEGVQKAIERYHREEMLGLPHEAEMPGAKEGRRLTTRKSIEKKKLIQKHSKTFGGSLSDAEVMQMAHIARNSYYKYKREIKSELEAEATAKADADEVDESSAIA